LRELKKELKGMERKVEEGWKGKGENEMHGKEKRGKEGQWELGSAIF